MRMLITAVTMSAWSFAQLGKIVADTTDPISMLASNTFANWISAIATSVCGVFLFRLLNKFDRMEERVGHVDRDLHIVASHANVTLPPRR